MNANVNPYYFTSVKCDECGSSKEVYKNRYTDNLLCIDCLNKQLNEVAPKQKQEFVIEEQVDE